MTRDGKCAGLWWLKDSGYGVLVETVGEGLELVRPGM